MTDIADIEDRDSFKAWLEETSQPREVSVLLAHRAALRVLPFAWRYGRRGEDKHLIPLLRAHVVVGLAAIDRPQLLTEQLLTESRHGRTSRAADPRHGRAWRAAYAAAGRAAAATAAADARAARAAAGDAAAAAAAAARAARVDLWKQVRADCQRLADGERINRRPVFSGRRPGWFASEWNAVRQSLNADWSFWVDWYERALSGKPQNWDLLEEIALQDDDFWQGSNAEVNARIAEIVEKHKAVDPPPGDTDHLAAALSMAEANSPNAEEIVLTDAGQFDAVPLREIAAFSFEDVKRRIDNAVEDMLPLAKTQRNMYAFVRAISSTFHWNSYGRPKARFQSMKL